MAQNLQVKPASAQDALQIGFKKDLANIRGYLEKLLPRGGVDRFERMALLACLRDPKLLECTKKSLLLAILWCAVHNMEPGSDQGCYLIPFKGKAIPVPSYKALINKAIECGAATSVDAFPVYANDQFYYRLGLDPDLTHEPPRLGEDRGDLVGAYVIITLPGGDKKFRVMDWPSIEKIRNTSASWRAAPETGIWKDWVEPMSIKTVIKQGLKTVPMKPELQDLLSEDGRVEKGATVSALLAESGTEVPKDLKEGPEDLEEAQKKDDTAVFDALVTRELAALSPEEASLRLAHLQENLKITAKNTKKTVPVFKAYVGDQYFGPYVNSRGEQKDGYWKSFLAWEAMPERPWNQSAGREPEEGHKDAGPAEQQPGPAVQEPDEVIPFAEHKKAVVMTILGKNIPLGDLDLAALDEITPDNIGDIEAKANAWGGKKG